jgi:homocysteine S-methyltransferase
MNAFLDALASRILLCDGAMGTMLYSKGVFINRCFESLTLSDAALVREVHAEYVRAGADILETNTFGASRLKLRAFGLGNRVADLNTEAARLAREAVALADGDERVFIAGAIGPLGVRVEPWGKLGLDEATDLFREQAAALAAGGVDLFMLETFRDPAEVEAAIAAVRSVSGLPIIAQMTTDEDGQTPDGAPVEACAPALVAAGADVVGLNCSVGPAPMLETLERLALVVSVPLSAQPNAGRPRDIEGRNLYLSSPDYLASYARRFVEHGVRIVGGCCGTTPEHIRQMQAAIRALNPRLAPRLAATRVAVTASVPETQAPVAVTGRSALGARLAAGQFVTSVEVAPPVGIDATSSLAAAAALAALGVDVVTVTDGTRTGAHVSALAMAVLARQAGIEVMLQYSCRDRNLLGIQSDLLGAHALGLRNVLGITGDPRYLGEIPDATAVFDVDSIGLTNLIARLNHGRDLAGQPLGSPAQFLCGVMANPSRDLDQELKRLAYKVDAGADFIVTRPVFDAGTFERFMRRIETFRRPVLVGLWPFDSALQAEFMANEVPGVTVPEPLVARMRACETAEAAADEGRAIAVEVLRAVRPMAHGVHLFAPGGRVADAARVLADLF